MPKRKYSSIDPDLKKAIDSENENWKLFEETENERKLKGTRTTSFRGMSSACFILQSNAAELFRKYICISHTNLDLTYDFYDKTINVSSEGILGSSQRFHSISNYFLNV